MKYRKSVFYLCLSAMCVALVAVCSYVVIPVGNLKFTLQLLAVLFLSGILPLSYALGAIVAYILLGLVGVPVFAGFSSGLTAIAGPTGGFILGFLPAVLLASLLLRAIKEPGYLKTAAVFALSTLIVYIVGTIGLYIYIPGKGLLYALSTGVLPYLLPDAAKILAAAFLVLKLKPLLTKFTTNAK